MKYVIKYLKEYRLRMEFGLIIKIIGTMMDLVLPYLLSYIIDSVIPAKDLKMIILLGVIMIICSVIGFLGSVYANQLASGVAKLVTRALRHDLFVKIKELSCSELDEITIPTLVSRMTSDTYNVHHMVGVMQRLGVRAPILLIGGIAVTLILDAKLTLILLAILPIIVIVTYFISKTGIGLFKDVQNAVDDLVRVIRENATGVRVIKALGKEDAEKERFENVNKTLIKAEEKSEKRMATLSPIINFVLNAGLVFVIVIGAVRVNNGVLAPGKILAFTTYFTIILNAMLSITRLFVIYSKANASAIRIAEILDKPCVNKNNEETLKNIKTSDDYITFEDVTFSYHKKYNNVSNISFSIKKRETLGIIGATGSGKSTIMQLLMRFYEADSGKIYVDGINIENISKENYHKLFGVVFQNDMIFSDTIYENIAMYRDIPLEQIKKAAHAASIDDFIETLPDKYDTLLNAKGTNLSGGQKLRILIARSLCNNPDILILDDASSALDYKTDATIRNRIKEMYQDTTMIVIAQRVSSVMNADKIVLLEEGEIIGYGTHQELLHKSLVYQEIYKLQMGVTDDAN